jgi:Fic family protein
MTTSKQGRKYQETHPWITFNFDARLLNYRIWLLLGEAQSKFEHIKGAPLLPATIKNLYNVYLAKGALATTAIEGNTLTESEVEKRIQGTLKLPPSKEYLGQEIDNVVEAYNLIGDNLLRKNDSGKLSVAAIKSFNKLVLKDLPLNEEVTPGQIRTYPVGVAGYRGAPPEDCEYLLERYVTWLNEEFVFPEEQRGIYGILKAILSHLYFVWIHPFEDGNGRTARLIEFQILLSVGAPAVAAHLLSNHYNQTRTEYYRNLDRTSRSGSDVSDFLLYALQGFVDGLRSEIESIQNQQIAVHWINHIHNSFKGKNSQTDERKKELMLEISRSDSLDFSFQKIRHLTPRIAELYATLSDRTLSRDLSDLEEMGLLLRKEDQYSSNLQILKLYKVPARSQF